MQRLTCLCLVSILIAGTFSVRAANPPQAAGKFAFEELKTNLADLMAAWKKTNREYNVAKGEKSPDVRWWPSSVITSDFDGDGDIDVCISHHWQPQDSATKIFFNQFKETGKYEFKDLTRERTLEGTFETVQACGTPYVFDYNDDGYSYHYMACGHGAGRPDERSIVSLSP